MWHLLLIFFYSVGEILASLSANYYCAEMNPQQHIMISQLMGMWYGLEIIDHLEEKHYKIHSTSCPIIHISEDRPPTTINSLYKNYNRSYGYGTGHGYGTPLPQYTRYPQEVIQQYADPSEYDRQTTYANYPEERRIRYSWRPIGDVKYLRLYWDEDGSTEYHLRYNVSRPGFWISSGPTYGMGLDPKFEHFAGTVQVLKAVGSHLVLNFCHRTPKRQLYTVILSREVDLKPLEIHGIHTMLHRNGLSTNAIKKVCSGGNKLVSTGFSLVLILIFVCKSFFNSRQSIEM